MALRVGIYGFKHGHIHSVVKALESIPGAELVVCAEDDPHYRQQAEAALGRKVVDATADQIIEHENLDIFGLGDAYGPRGRIVIKALQAGCHIMGDKPLCTRLGELDQIERLVAAGNLAVSLMLTIRYKAQYAELQRQIAGGLIGEVRSLQAFGPHPLNWGVRPDWYFTPELHGGIINDLQCHGVDFMRWMSGQELDRVLAALVGNVATPQAPDFEDIGQCACLFGGGARFAGEVSYLTPPKGRCIGWMFLGWGTAGQFKLDTAADLVAVDIAGQGAVEIAAPPLARSTPIADLVHYLQTGEEPLLTTAEALRSSRAVLTIQAAAQRV